MEGDEKRPFFANPISLPLGEEIWSLIHGVGIEWTTQWEAGEMCFLSMVCDCKSINLFLFRQFFVGCSFMSDSPEHKRSRSRSPLAAAPRSEEGRGGYNYEGGAAPREVGVG
jgi:hypothetical protein